jgi:hypothetical protein
LEAIIGTPFQRLEEYLNLKPRSKDTSERLLMVERFGRISTLLKSNLCPNSIWVIIMYNEVNIILNRFNKIIYLILPKKGIK